MADPATDLEKLRQQRAGVEAEIARLRGFPPPTALPTTGGFFPPAPSPAPRRLGWGSAALLGLGALGIAFAAWKSTTRRR